MRKLFIISTAVFWLGVAGFWFAGYISPPVKIPQATSAMEPSLREYGLAEVAQHSKGSDCWMGIEGQVYDLTSYLPSHPSAPEIVLPWCGKEASHAWQTKTVGRPHSTRAHYLLRQYLIGRLREAP